ncbi:MAG: YqaJ viral recombinase family protein [Clostridiales bacterium]|nr:YqaJ viral recombinase family protein [Clostridiales bacterium]
MDTQRMYRPNVLVADTSALTREQWLQVRRDGIGGSDAAAVLGISPFKTRKELYWDKAGIPDENAGDDDAWLAKEAGNCLEGLVVQVFCRKNPGWDVYQDTRMYQHAVYPWMLADIDRIAVHRKTGRAYILEIKTCDVHVLDKWGDKNSNVIPPEYEAQGRHYMSVLGLGGVVFACLGGTRMYGYRQRFLTRDAAKEQALIRAEADFWNNFVKKEAEPPFNGHEDAGMVLAALSSHYRKRNAVKRIPDAYIGNVTQVNLLNDRISGLNRELEQLKRQRDRYLAPIAEYLQGADGVFETEKDATEFRFIERKSVIVASDSLPGLKLEYPEAYEKFVLESKSGFWKAKRKRRNI